MKKIFALLGLTALFGCGSEKPKIQLNLIPVEKDNYWGYVNKEGKELIRPQFKAAYAFIEGLALVRNTEDKYGFIDEKGNIVIPAVYKEATHFYEGLAAVVRPDGKIEYINKTGKTVLTAPNEVDMASFFCEGLALIQQGGKYGYMDKEGKIVIAPQFESANRFSEGLAAVEQKSDNKTKVGFIDKKGKFVITPQFDMALSFSEGKACVRIDGKYGFIDKSGKLIITPQFEDVYSFSGGLARAKQGELWGFIGEDGKFAINPQFKEALDFNEDGIAAIKATSSESKWGFIDKKGKMVIEPQFEAVSGFVEDIALMGLGDKVGIIDRKGRYLVNPMYDNVNLLTTSAYLVESDYFDAGSITGLLFNSMNEKTFKNIGKGSSFASLKKIFPDLTHDNYSNFIPGTAEENKNLGLARIGFAFQDGFVEIKTKYRNEQRYDYWSASYVNTQVFDGYDYVYNDNSPLKAAAFIYKITGSKARDKKKDLLRMIKEKLPANFKVDYREGDHILANNNSYYLYIKVDEDDHEIMVNLLFNKEDVASFQSSTESYDTQGTFATADTTGGAYYH